MTIYRRFLILVFAALLVLITIASRSGDSIKSTRIWRNAPQMIGLGDLMDEEDEERILTPPQLPEDPSSLQSGQQSGAVFSDDKSSKFQPGTVKPYGSTYTKAVVMGRLLSENTTWLDSADLPAGISKFVYNADTSASPFADTLPLPRPKGHEAMVYLTYIIEHYSSLADVNIFVHAHQHAWHNNEMLNHDAVETIKRLSAERVTREGYMNLRCHWKPGCPEYIHPGVVYADINKQEESAIARVWSALFPSDQIPGVLASACCAQFAVSKERITSIPLERFKFYRRWLLETDLDDYVSGRVFEYLWHKIFTDQSSFCPDMRVCYCDGYGVCFDDDAEFDYWFELKYKKRAAEKKLTEWWELVTELDRRKKKVGVDRIGLQGLEEVDLRVPAVDADVVLMREIRDYKVALEERRLKALEAGTDPRVRAKVAGREWKEGDGY